MATPTITSENVNALLERYTTVAWQSNEQANLRDGATLKRWFVFLSKTDDTPVLEGEVVLTTSNVYESIFSFLEKSPKSCFNLADASFIDELRTFVIQNFLQESEEKIVEL